MIKMPIDTRPLANAMVPSDTSHLGARKPPASSATKATAVMVSRRRPG